MVNRKEKVNINGVQVKDMLVNFTKDSSMARANGKVQGKPLAPMFMKETICMIRSMEKVSSHGQVATFTREIIMRTKGMAMVKCSGLMVVCMKENGLEVSSMELVG